MADTLIQIKRSTTTAVPTQLQPGELAYSSNGDVLFIGSPAGSNTANVVAIGGKRNPGVLTASQALVANASSWIDNIQTAKLIVGTPGETVNVTSISTDGALSSVSNSQLVTAWAVKNYVDTMGSSADLGGLTDVTLSSPANNNILVYDAGAGQWENHTIDGTANEVDVTFTGHNITVGLPDSVTVTNQLTTNTLAVSDTTESTSTTSGAATIAGGLGVAKKINTKELAVGNSSVFTTVNSTSVSTVDVLASGTVNGAVLSVGNKFKANTTEVVIANDVALKANGSVGTDGQVLTSNGTTVYWSTISADITAVSAGVGLDGGGSSGDVTLSVLANNGIIANTNGVFVNPGTGVTVNSTGVHIGQSVGTTDSVTFNAVSATGNVALGSDGNDIVSVNGKVNTSIIPDANETYALGSTNDRWSSVFANNIQTGFLTVDNNVQVAGNLTVTGSLVTINVATLSVIDPLIQLAANNTAADTIDIGFFGNYGASGEHAGLFRDASDGVFKLFKGLTAAPGTTVSTSDGSYSVATLQAYLDSGVLTSNSTGVTITANASMSVGITANTLSLASALVVGSGGTGKATFTNNAVLFGNTAGALSEAAGSNGQVLQITNDVPTFGGLDGGTF